MRVTRYRIALPTALAGALLLSAYGVSSSATQNPVSSSSSRSSPLSSEAVCTLIGAGEVVVRAGLRLLTVGASALGVTTKRDAVVSAAGTAAAQLR